MLNLLINTFFLLIPRPFLTPLTKMVNGKVTCLNEQELRKRHAESFTNRAEQKIRQANIIGNYLARKKEQQSRAKHYLLIGELCVHFSNLEQQIKDFLRKFDGSKNNETKSGKPLVEAFIKALKKSTLEYEIKTQIEVFLESYISLAQKRNQILKASYSYSTSDSEIKKINNKVLDEFKQFDNDWDSYISAWIEDIDKNHFKKVIAEIKELQAHLLQLQYECFLHLSHPC